MKSRALALAGPLMILLLARAGALDRIRVESPLVDPADAAETVQDLLLQTASVSNRINATSFLLLPPGEPGPADFVLKTVASLGEDNPAVVISLTRLRDGAQSATYPWIGKPVPQLPSLLAKAAFLLWGSFTPAREADGAQSSGPSAGGFVGRPAGDPPVLVDELPTALISPYAYPWSVAVKKNGNILAALSSSCSELDPSFRPVEEHARELSAGQTPIYFVGLSATPEGTLFLKPAQGRDLYKISPGTAPQKIPTGTEVTLLAYAALPDGSVIIADSMAHKAYRLAVGKKRRELALFANQYEYLSCLGTAPDGTIWIWDVYQKAFRIYTSEGKLADYLVLLTDPSRPLTPVSITIAGDGSFIVLANGELLKFSRDGRLQWRLGTLEGAEAGKLPASGSVAADWGRGLIYVADTTGRRIIKLLDRAWCRQNGIRNELEEKLVALRASGDDGSAASLAEAASLYEQAGSTLMAKAWWQKALDQDPQDRAAAARLLALEVSDLAREAADLDRRARDTFRSVGRESARPIGSQALQKYELLLSKEPANAQAREAMTGLRDLLDGKDREEKRKMPLSITEARITNIFPGLMQYYAGHPAGSVIVTNTLDKPVLKVRARILIPRFMDFPSEGAALPALDPGASATLPLSLTLSPAVLALQEDMVVQARVEAVCVVDGAEQSIGQVISVTIYRNTALTWDDTRKIASFITPNEEVVSGFAHRAASLSVVALPAASPPAAGAEEAPGKTYRLSARFLQAVRVCDALGAYGIEYVPDPDSPISKALGKTELIDTVRFPRDTLSFRGGDCDDTTALLASMLESIGVHTAVLTTPGHIFLAFNSGEPAQDAPFISSNELEVITEAGAAWVPVETTVLKKGFLQAWRTASELVKQYEKSGPLQFLPLASMRDLYPALALPPSTITIVEPTPRAVGRAFSASMEGLETSVYTARLAELEAALSGLQGVKAARILNREGVLHALYGRDAEAARAFERAMTAAPASASPYMNLATLKLSGGDAGGALASARAGLARDPASAPLRQLEAACARALAQKGAGGQGGKGAGESSGQGADGRGSTQPAGIASDAKGPGERGTAVAGATAAGGTSEARGAEAGGSGLGGGLSWDLGD